MIVESDVPFSASWVMAQCRRSWNRNPGRPALFVNVLHAVRQLFTCRVGSKPVTLSEGQWRAIAPKLEKGPFGLFGLSALEENIERGSLSVNRWQDIEQGLVEGLKPKPEQEFLTNSLQHLREENLRLALIEATVCLEIVLSQTIQLHLQVKRSFSKKRIEAVLNNVGLTSRVGLLVESIFALNERSGLQLDKVLQAINWRNKII